MKDKQRRRRWEIEHLKTKRVVEWLKKAVLGIGEKPSATTQRPSLRAGDTTGPCRKIRIGDCFERRISLLKKNDFSRFLQFEIALDSKCKTNLQEGNVVKEEDEVAFRQTDPSEYSKSLA